MSKCYYPDWEGGLTVSKHDFDENGWCIICGFNRWEGTERFKQILIRMSTDNVDAKGKEKANDH